MALRVRESFRQYILRGVSRTRNELGRGSYAVVLELKYRGLKCAGKKLYRALYEAGIGHAARRFLEECELLNKARHPNIVQFLGVCFEEGSEFPILVMEYLPTNLSSCLDRYGILPKEISYSILHDVSLGLAYLHGQTPPIIHRDLSANNILLSTNMAAKISDLGVARILNLTPLKASRMTETPGTPAYMPPEVMVANPHYDSSVDVFSFGVMMIHTFTAEWPLPKIGQTRADPDDPDKLIPVTEIERREEFLRKIPQDNPLLNLVMNCLRNNPQRRPQIEEIVGRMRDVIRQFPPSFENRIELLQHITVLSTLNEQLQKSVDLKDMVLEEKEAENEELKLLCVGEAAEAAIRGARIDELEIKIQELYDEMQKQKDKSESKIEQIEMAHSALSTQLEIEKHQKNSFRDHLKVVESLLEAKDTKFNALSEQLSKFQHHMISKSQCTKVKLISNQCADAPIRMEFGRVIVINENIYYGGGMCDASDGSEDDYRIYCYKESADVWSTLPTLPVCWFGMGNFNGKLVTVGGLIRNEQYNECVVTNMCFVYSKYTLMWEQSIEPMPTARESPSVISYKAHLIVAGGCISGVCTNVIEVYNSFTSQWNVTQGLPSPCTDVSATVYNDRIFLVGGRKTNSTYATLACSADINELLSTKMSMPKKAIWKVMSNPPAHHSIIFVLFDMVVALGGKTIQDALPTKCVYAYSISSDSWVYICDLPFQVLGVAAAPLASNEFEFFTVGGIDKNGGRMCAAQKCTCCVSIP